MVVDAKEVEVVNTLVFETLGNPEREREFKFKVIEKMGI